MTDDDLEQKLRRRFDAESNYSAEERAIANLDEGWAKAALFFRTGKHFGHQPGRLRARGLISIREGIEVFGKRFKEGNTLALLHAVALCAEENVPLPTWLATAYCHQLDLFLNPGSHTSLDKVFQSPTLPTDTPAKAAAARQDWLLGGLIWDETWAVVMNDESVTSVDSALTMALKKRDFGVKKTKARKLFLMVDNNQAEHTSSKTLSRFLEIRRKQLDSK